jgi:tetratricopeptide (TPR) repeat protein
MQLLLSTLLLSSLLLHYAASPQHNTLGMLRPTIPHPLARPPVHNTASRLVEEHPDRAVSWFAVGCYYMCAQQHESARRYFGKATALDRSFAPAWVAFGHAFAAQDESDQVGWGWVGGGVGSLPLKRQAPTVRPRQNCEGWLSLLRSPAQHSQPLSLQAELISVPGTRANTHTHAAGSGPRRHRLTRLHAAPCLQAMAAYRTAHRLFPGLHAPLMGMGQEYQRMNNLGLAEQCFSQVWVGGGGGLCWAPLRCCDPAGGLLGAWWGGCA